MFQVRKEGASAKRLQERPMAGAHVVSEEAQGGARGAQAASAGRAGGAYALCMGVDDGEGEFTEVTRRRCQGGLASLGECCARPCGQTQRERKAARRNGFHANASSFLDLLAEEDDGDAATAATEPAGSQPTKSRSEPAKAVEQTTYNKPEASVMFHPPLSAARAASGLKAMHFLNSMAYFTYVYAYYDTHT